MTDDFFINLATEHEYRFKGDYQHLNLTADGLSYEVQGIDYQPGPYHSFEIEFALHPDISPDSEFWAGLYLLGSYTGEGEYSGYSANYTGSATEPHSRGFSIKPYIGFLTKIGPMPVSLQLSRQMPWEAFTSRNSKAIDIVELKLRAYLQF